MFTLELSNSLESVCGSQCSSSSDHMWSDKATGSSSASVTSEPSEMNTSIRDVAQTAASGPPSPELAQSPKRAMLALETAAQQVEEAAWDNLLQIAVHYCTAEAHYRCAPANTVEEARWLKEVQLACGPLAAAADRLDVFGIAERLESLRPAAASSGGGAKHAGAVLASERQKRTLFGPLVGGSASPTLLATRAALLMCVHAKLALLRHASPVAPATSTAPAPAPAAERPKDDQRPGREGADRQTQPRQAQAQGRQPKQQPQRRGGIGGSGSSSSSGSAAGSGGGGGADGSGGGGGGGGWEGADDPNANLRMGWSVLLADRLISCYAGLPPLLYHELQLLVMVAVHFQMETLVSTPHLASGLDSILAEQSCPERLVRVIRCLSGVSSPVLSAGVDAGRGNYMRELATMHPKSLTQAIRRAAAVARGPYNARLRNQICLRDLYAEELAKRKRESVFVRGATPEEVLRDVDRWLFGGLTDLLPEQVFGGGGGGGGVVAVARAVKCDCDESRLAEARLGLGRALVAALAAEEAAASGGGVGGAEASEAPPQKQLPLVAVGFEAIHLALSSAAALSCLRFNVARRTAAAAVAAAGAGPGGGRCFGGAVEGPGGGPMLLTLMSSPQLAAQHGGRPEDQESLPDVVKEVLDKNKMMGKNMRLQLVFKMRDYVQAGSNSKMPPNVVSMSFLAAGRDVTAALQGLRERRETPPVLMGAMPSGLPQVRRQLQQHLDEYQPVVVRCMFPFLLAPAAAMLGELHVEYLRKGRSFVVVPLPLSHLSRDSPSTRESDASLAPEDHLTPHAVRRVLRAVSTAAPTSAAPTIPNAATATSTSATATTSNSASGAARSSPVAAPHAPGSGGAGAHGGRAVPEQQDSGSGADAGPGAGLQLRRNWRLRHGMALRAAVSELVGTGWWVRRGGVPGGRQAGGAGAGGSANVGGGDDGGGWDSEGEGGGGEAEGGQRQASERANSAAECCIGLDLLVVPCCLGQPGALLLQPLPPPQQQQAQAHWQ